MSERTALDLSFFDHLRHLLDLEAEAEKEQAANRPSDERDRLTGLRIHEEDAGLGGRLLLTVGLRDRQRELPPHRFQPGSPAILVAEDTKPPFALRAVVSERTPTTIRVAVDDPEDGMPDAEEWRLDPSPDEIARRRQLAALGKASAARGNRLADLRRALLGQREPEFASPLEFPLLNSSLNPSQEDAVRFAMRIKDLAIIHGPPGTGKTTTVVEVIRQAVQRGEKVLACAPSNMAVDNLLEKLMAAGEKPVRLGHPARVSPELRERTLDVLADQHPDAKTARKLTREAFAMFRKAGRWTRAKPEPGEKQSMRAEARSMLDDARRLEDQATSAIIDRASILCATLTGVDERLLGERVFDWVIIDEACQSAEPACWIPIGRARRIVLAGDHCQLPPTILSPIAAKKGLSISFMERLVETFGPMATRLLTIQYRMHRDIMQFSSDEFYGGTLQADASVSTDESPVRFYDTAGASFDEEPEPEGSSRRNPQEADLVIKKVNELIEGGMLPSQIGVITPYAAQVRWLRDRLKIDGLEIDSVDGFQGREKDAIVISFVRSNVEGDIGFLADTRRTNVALTRARRKLIVIGDSATLGNHPFYSRLLTYFDTIGAYGSVWEEM